MGEPINPSVAARSIEVPNARIERSLERAGWLPLLALSFALSAGLPLLGLTPLADLNAHYTDHVRQPYATWVFLERGMSMYWTPFGDAARGVEYRQPIHEWLDVPYVYPPGAFAVFLPLAAIGQWVPMTQHTFAQVGILYLLLLSHLALLGVVRTLQAQPPGGRVLVGITAWMVFLHLALQGQYEAVWIACGAIALWRLRQERPASALFWICCAALLHYRAAILFPVGVVALVRSVRGTPWRTWPWMTLLLVAATGAICVWTFVLMTPGAAAGGAARLSFYANPSWWRIAGIVILTVAFSLVALWCADGMVSGLVAVSGVLAIVDTHNWWHAAMLVLVPLAVGSMRAPRRPTLARGALVLWLCLLQPVAWGGNPLWLFRNTTRYVLRIG